MQKNSVLSHLFLTIRVPPLSTFLAVLFVWEKSIEKLTTFFFSFIPLIINCDGTKEIILYGLYNCLVL